MGGGHKPGTPGAPAKPYPYAGDDRLARVLAVLRAGGQPSAAQLAAEWGSKCAPASPWRRKALRKSRRGSRRLAARHARTFIRLLADAMATSKKGAEH
jgi:hypothetical protein